MPARRSRKTRMKQSKTGRAKKNARRRTKKALEV